MVVFDTNFLVMLLQDDFPPVTHPDTKEKFKGEDVKRRIAHLICELQKKRSKILIPTPVLAEVFTRFGSQTDEIIQILGRDYGFQFAPFDTKAAIEAGMAFYSARQKGDKKAGSRRAWQRVKFDRQVVSIAKAHGASIVYSNDKQVRTWASELGMTALAVWDLDPPPPQQMHLVESDGDSEPETRANGEGNDDE